MGNMFDKILDGAKDAVDVIKTVDKADRQVDRGREGQAIGTIGKAIKREERQQHREEVREWKEDKQEANGAYREARQDWKEDMKSCKASFSPATMPAFGDLEQAYQARLQELEVQKASGDISRQEFREAKREARQDYKEAKQELQGDYYEACAGPRPEKPDVGDKPKFDGGTGQDMMDAGKVIDQVQKMEGVLNKVGISI